MCFETGVFSENPTHLSEKAKLGEAASKLDGWMAGLESVSSSGAFQITGCLRAGLGQTIAIENTGSIREDLVLLFHFLMPI